MNYFFRNFRQWRLLLICAMIGFVFAGARLLDPASTANVNPQYRVSPTCEGFLKHLGHWSYEAAHQLPAQHRVLRRGLISLAILLLVAWTWRRYRVVTWCIASFVFGVLPVAFIPQRGLEAILVPLIAIATLLGFAIDRLLWKPFGFAAVLAIILLQGSPESRAGGWSFREVDRVIETVMQATQDLRPRPGVDQHIVIESDPFEEMNWADVFVFRLVLNQPELMVHRRSQLTERQLREFRNNRFLRWQQGRWQEVGR